MDNKMEMTVYGAEQACPSCLHSPSSRETMEWIRAAIQRKYPDSSISIRYVDINQPETDEDKTFTDKILNDELFYPLVVTNGKVIGEGNPRLKTIFQTIEENGFKSA
ncbi:disulfide oxidoreductase YuzD [Scopulibacillus darangshiensis]|uniref:Disulfide oxidoreductase YuzD n=1 Tax=Scopulibacillus darangshiensis TaxID=442528 RepID=A0A4R2NX24_9BACL|nr:YuzD family protein [Scopulibacillus darangshiensis]TCP26577.1 disulfide oxidoreductase YuzD [Scopulibacillus darangshiensis]